MVAQVLQSFGQRHHALRCSASRWHASGAQQHGKVTCSAVHREMRRVLAAVAWRVCGWTVTLQRWVVVVQQWLVVCCFASHECSKTATSCNGGGCGALHAVAHGLQLKVRCSRVQQVKSAAKSGVVVAKRVEWWANGKRSWHRGLWRQFVRRVLGAL